jgi:threonine dehydrogenase-like Zn-dependent dehydrogenase
VLQVAMSGGEVRVVEVPEPTVRRGCVLVRTSHSLISAGTESAGIGSGGRRENIVLRAIRNPALVKKVVDRVASHGLQATAELVRTRISTEIPSGYSSSGVVVEVGDDVSDLRVGDRVACAGAGYANHAGVNVVPRNLVALVPGGVSFEEAAFCTLGAIALQGVRRTEPGLGDRVAVLGLGLLGQLTVQMLKAAGAIVIGVDVRPERVARAQALGLDAGFTVAERDFVAGVLERTGGRGADAVVVTAAGGDAGLLNKAFEACRRKGRVVLVGDVPIRIQRDKIYKKEIDFLISTSYGPGRYDESYEEKGHDYPFGYVRWTEGRNLEEVLRQVEAGRLKVRPLIDSTHAIEDASAAYASLASDNRPIGVLIDYHLDLSAPALHRVAYRPLRRAPAASKAGTLGVGVVGYGAYFRSMLLPLLKGHAGFSLASACARSGLTVRAAVENDGFAKGTTDYR